MSAIFVLDKGTAKYDYEANRAAFSGELKARGIANLTFSDIAASKNKSVYDFHMLLDVYRSNVSSEIISYFSDQKNADLFESNAVNRLLAEAYVAQGDDLKGEELIARNLPGAGEKPSNIPAALWESNSRTNHKITLMELGRMQIKYASLEKARRTFSELGDSLMTSEISEVLEATSKK